MSVDSTLFAGTGKLTKHGAKRNKNAFWRLWDEKYPGTLSERNLENIARNDAPVVDSQWLQHFPEHQNFIGKTLEHHHIDHDILTTGLPEKLHRGKGNSKIWHQN